MNIRLTVDQKFAKTINELRNIRPFYSAIYESMERVESDMVDTMGVTANKMLYNHKFVDSLSFNKLMFIQLHEIGHVALMHVPRLEKRDPQLWNIACDLYVNKLLSEEFNIEPGETDTNKIVTFPKEGLYCSSIDLEVDYVEGIYDTLISQAKSNGYMGGSSGYADDTNQNSNNSKNNTDGESFTFEYKGSGTSRDSYSSITIEIVPDNYSCDIIDDGSDTLQKQNDNQRILSDAKMRNELHSYSKNGKGLLEIKVDEILKSYVDWKKLLRKHCIILKSKDSSFSTPDKRMYYQSAIYPGQISDESNSLKDIKICFDASGSISKKDMSYFYGQVHDILKSFKVNAEVVYWDTAVEARSDFATVVDFNKVTGKGGGGTNPDCIFEYFDSKQCKNKPSVSLIFTDGFFGEIDGSKRWARKYKNTIWVMTRNYNTDFKPPFGKLTIAKFLD